MTNEALFATVAVWQAAKVAATAAVAAELEAREKMCAAMFPDRATLDGTQYAALTNGWQLKGVFGTNYKVNAASVATATRELNEQLGQETGAHIAASLFKWKPEVSVTAYKLLAPKALMIADRGITTTPKLPTFELVAPK